MLLLAAMPLDETKVITASSASARIIATGIVIAFCYFASSILVTLIIAVLLAYFLDPVVTWLENWHIPRALGSLLIVLLTLVLLGMLGWLLVERMDQFSSDWPKYRAPLRSVSAEFERRLESLESHVSEIEPNQAVGPRIFAVADPHPVRTALLGRLSSLYAFLFGATFMPFLVFFMLSAKRQVWHATMQLFPPNKRTEVKDALADVTKVLRSYLMGTALVGLILVVASWLFFMALGLDFPFLTGLVSGLCNLIPYLGAVLAWLPPLFIGLRQYHGLAPYLGIFSVLTAFHMITANLLIPALVGWRVRLNALALTVSLLFWGWLWGALGLIVAIPITAVIKVICDHVDRWNPIGRWLSA